MNKNSVLIIEDEAEIRKFLQTVFVANGFEVKLASSANEGLKLISLYPPEIVILDLGLPDLDGIEVIKNIRKWLQVPIIVLSARGQENQKVEALEAGANDYLTKPFGTAELLARIKVALRHLNKNSTAVFEIGELKIDLEKRLVLLKNSEIHLTKIEYKLLNVLVRNAGKVLTHSQLLQEVWGKNSIENGHYLRIYMQHLREKLEDDALSPKYIFTEVGVGYRFKAGS